MATARFTPLARSGLKEIRDFIARDKPNVASQYMAMLKQKCELLGHSPGLGIRRDEYCGLYKFPVDSYLIFDDILKLALMSSVSCTVTVTLKTS